MMVSFTSSFLKNMLSGGGGQGTAGGVLGSCCEPLLSSLFTFFPLDISFHWPSVRRWLVPSTRKGGTVYLFYVLWMGSLISLATLYFSSVLAAALRVVVACPKALVGPRMSE